MFSFDEKRKEIEIENSDQCTLCQECVKFSQDYEAETAVFIGEQDYKFNFIVESTGALTPNEIVVKAMQIL